MYMYFVKRNETHKDNKETPGLCSQGQAVFFAFSLYKTLPP